MNFYVDIPPVSGSGGGATWGSITGTLSAQTDLQNALNAKLSLSGGTMSGSINLGGHDISNGGRFAQGITVHTLTSGEDYTIANNWGTVVFNSGSPVATQTTHMPGLPLNGQTLTINCVGGGITAWTLNTTDGSTITPAAPTSLLAGQTYTYTYTSLASGYWILTSKSTLETLSSNLNFSPTNTYNIGETDGTNTVLGPKNINASAFQTHGADLSIGDYVNDGDATGNLIFSYDDNGDIGRDENGTLLRPSNVLAARSMQVGTAGEVDIGVNTILDTAGSAAGLRIVASSVTPGDALGSLELNAYDVHLNASHFTYTGPLNITGGITASGQVGVVGGATLYVSATAGGLANFSVSTADRLAMTSVPTGLQVFDIDLNKLCFYGTDAAWHVVTSV